MTRSDPVSAGHEDRGGDAAAYLLGALEPEEVNDFRGHMGRCVVCRDDLEGLEPAVQALAMSAPQVSAPRGLRRRVLRAARAERRPGARPRSQGRSAGSWWRPWPAVAAVAAAIAVVIVTSLGLGAGSGSRLFNARVVGIAGTAELRLTQGRGELIVRHLSPPPPGRVYEVWLQRPDGGPSPAGVLFSVIPPGNAEVGLPGSIRRVSWMMVTPEPAGGSQTPTESPVIVARLS